MDYRVILLTGEDIPIPEIPITLHQPTIKEIGMMGEKNFFTAAQCLCINKTLYIEDENLLSETTNFKIFMTIIEDKAQVEKKEAVLQLLSILFPQCKNIMIMPTGTLLLNIDPDNVIIDENNFEVLQAVFKQVFCLAESGQESFNPGNEAAKKIADKLMRARQRVAAQKAAENGNGSIFAQYLSIISLAESISIRELSNYTIYMLYDQIERYMLYTNWDLDIKQRLAGGKPDSSPDN